MQDKATLEMLLESIRDDFPDLGYAWELVVRGAHCHLLDDDSLTSLIQHLHQQQDYILDELAFEFVSGELRVRLVDETATCNERLMLQALTRAQQQLGKTLAVSAADDRLEPENRPVHLKTADGQFQFTIQPGTTMLVGRDNSCDIQISDPSMGRRQAYFHHTGRICSVEDADSPSGTYVNDIMIREATALKYGDRVLLSGMMFIVSSWLKGPCPSA